MCAQATQKNRSISIKTPLGGDKLVLSRFSYSDSLNAPFVMTADLLSSDQSISFDQIVGHPVTITMDLAGGGKRHFHGIVSNFVQTGREVGTAVYHATIVPWLAHLSNVSDCQIFQNETIPDIVSKVIKKAGFTDIVVDLAETYSPLEFCVQYRESNRSFVSRLMEKAGICYYFKHEESRHVLVLTDRVSKHTPYDGYDTILYREAEAAGSLVEAIRSWTLSMQARTVRFAQTDFDFKRPDVDLKVVSPVSRSHGLADFEQFDYPGEYVDAADGEQFAKARIEAIQSQQEVVAGQTSCRGVATGRTFKLKDHPRADQNREYLLTHVDLHFDAGGFSSGNGGSLDGNAESFSCTFTAMPTTHQYRPARLIRKPLIVGPQTAIVTGPAKDEIHTDEHGRVKVHFHWDRYGKYDADSSCWVRVSQLWAGKGWGAMHIPRIGQEVIVEFLEGDPDRPIITGRVYNGVEKPPYALPGSKNISTLMSRSTKNGASDNFNEVKMDDTKGEELLHIQAEKDRTVLVKNDNTETVKHDESIEIGNDRKKHVEKNEDVTVGGNRTEEVTKNETITIHENRSEKVDKDETLTIGKNRSHEVGDNDSLKVGKKLLIDVGDEITIRTGKSSIVMKKDGTITISGKDITVTGTGEINVKAVKDVVIKGKNVLSN
jgi:type VI secretion system secreted protein VgrG